LHAVKNGRRGAPENADYAMLHCKTAIIAPKRLFFWSFFGTMPAIQIRRQRADFVLVE
jgi:hypothetical protein